MNDTHTNTYEERIESLNIAESRFEFWCDGKNIWYCRMGFDETNHTVPYFWKIHPLIRNLPDYLMNLKEKLYYVHIKGTDKLKIKDLEQYSKFDKLYCNSDTPLYLAFCLKDGYPPIFKSIKAIEVMIEGLEIQTFPTDNKEYYALPL